MKYVYVKRGERPYKMALLKETDKFIYAQPQHLIDDRVWYSFIKFSKKYKHDTGLKPEFRSSGFQLVEYSEYARLSGSDKENSPFLKVSNSTPLQTSGKIGG